MKLKLDASMLIEMLGRERGRMAREYHKDVNENLYITSGYEKFRAYRIDKKKGLYPKRKGE